MSRNYSKKARQRTTTSPRRFKRHLYPIVAVLLLGISILAFSNRHRIFTPEPPGIALESVDPAVADLIRKHVDNVNRAPRSARSWGELGVVYMLYDYRVQADACLTRAERLDPEEPRWSYYISYANRTDNLVRSLEKLEESVAKDSGNHSVLELELADRYSEAGRFEEAERLYQSVLEREPENILALFGKGKLAYANGEFEESRHFLEQTSQSPYTAKKSLSLLGTVYFRLGAEEESKTATQSANEASEDLVWPNPFLVEAAQFQTGHKAWVANVNRLTSRNRYQEILPWAQKLIENYPEEVEGWTALGRVRMSEGNFSAAEEAYREAAERSSTSIESHMQLGVAIMNQRRFEEAIPPFEKALQLKPDLGEAWYNLGFCQGMTGNIEPAMESFRNAIRYNPQLFLAYLRLAELHIQQNQMAEAASVLADAEEIQPDDPTLRALKEML